LDAIEGIRNNQDVFVLFPTGGGKSICYQAAALSMPGCCVVISPLIALMKDQVDALKSKGVPATFLHSGLSRKAIRNEIDALLQGRYKMFYIAPERLANREFVQALGNSDISFLAVDEAHCISQWGFEFRPSYRKIADLKEKILKLNIMALTASATPEVQLDIKEQLHLHEPLTVSKSFSRPNLSYIVDFSEDKIGAITREIKKATGSSIIYVRNRRLTVELAKLFNDSGVSSLPYHAGLSHEKRNFVQASWMTGETKLVVATNAFGMGIDKSDVRLVIHYIFPDSLESYYQEAGRAGRDGKASKCLVYYSPTDVETARSNLLGQYPTLDFLKVIYEAISNFLGVPIQAGLGVAYPFDLSVFSKKFGHKGIQVYNAIQLLEKLGYFHLSEGVKVASKVQILIDSRQLYAFQVKFEKYDALLKVLVRKYGGIFSVPTSIEEASLANLLKLSRAKVVELLNELDKVEIIAYTESSDKPRITYLRNRVQQITDPANFIHENKKRNQKRLEEMINFLESEDCRMRLICDYFGESIKDDCGKCDICVLKRELTSTGVDQESIETQIKELLQEQPQSLMELKATLNTSSLDISAIVRTCIEEEKIRLDHNQNLHWV